MTCQKSDHRDPPKCWKQVQCNRHHCPAYQSNEFCWFVSGTFCFSKKQSSFLEKTDLCMDCEVFLRYFGIQDKSESAKYIIKEMARYVKKLEQGKDDLQQTLERKNMELEEALALSKVKEKMVIDSLKEAESLSTGLVESLSQTEEKQLALEEAVALLKTKEKMLVESVRESDILSTTLHNTLSDLQKTTVSKNYLDNILKSMNDLLVVISPNGRINAVNRALGDTLGYSKDELIDQPVELIFSDKEFSKNVSEYQAMLNHDKLINYETNWKTKDNRLIPVLVSTSTMGSRRNNYIEVIITGKDITNRKRFEHELEQYAEKLKQSNQELQDFASIASHDLQEPLRKVMAFGDRLKKKFSQGLGDQGNDYIDRMQRATARMQVLINDLLSYSRVTSKGREFKPVSLETITQDVVSDLEVRIKNTGGTVEVSSLPMVMADPLQMRQLMQNIIGNALKFHQPDIAPLVTIQGEVVDQCPNKVKNNGASKYCQLTITDNGIGFEEKYADRIFGIFQRLHNRNEYEGTGIGLAVCRKIVDRHHGELIVHSQPGKGTSFIIYLPAKV